MSFPPRAEQRPVRQTLHGIERVDPYAWLRADNWQEVMKDPSVLDADIRQYLEAENEHLKTTLVSTESLQERLFEEYRGRIKEDDSTVPAPDGPWAYYSRYETGGQHPIFCRRPRDDEGSNREQVLLHGDRMAEGHPYFRIGAVDHSHDHRIVAYAVDDKGSEYFTLRFKDLETGEHLADVIEDTSGNFSWARDNRTVFYTMLDENHRPQAVRRHRLGTPVTDDVTVYQEADSGFFVGVGLTESRAFITIETHDHVTSETWLIPADAPETPPRRVAEREPEIEYDVGHHGDRLIIRTNRDGAEDFKIVEAPLDDPAPANWKDLVAHEPGRLIIDLELYAGHLVRMERVDALPRIVITPLTAPSGASAESPDSHTIAFEEEAYSAGLVGGYEFDTTTLRFAYSSMTTPSRVYDYDMLTRQRTLRKEQEVPSGHDPSDYRSRRLMARSPDGEEVPISILHHRDTPIDGTAPLLLYGYGSYGHALPASFGVTRLSLVDRGFVFALAHVRGGIEKGYHWYKAGKLAAKTNSFTDFIAAAEALRTTGYAHPDKICAQGGSAGGMLMGAIANRRPDLFAAIVADVPFVDVLNTMCDASLPLTPPEWPEWGNPVESEEAYRWIASYSPYDNVSAQAYPAMLVTAGLTDPRVTYWEPAKWVAKLRATKTDDRALLFKTNMEAGHAGAAGRFDSLKETALEQAFLLWVFDLVASA